MMGNDSGKAVTGSEVSLRSENDNLKLALEQERKARVAVERRLAREVALTEKRIKEHLSYRLGKEIVASRRSPLAWISLPRRLLRAYSSYKSDVKGKGEEQIKRANPALIELYRREGAEGVAKQIGQSGEEMTAAEVARALIQAGRTLAQAGQTTAELELTAEAARLDSSTTTLRARFWACHRAANHAGAVEVAEQLWKIAEEQDLDRDERARLDKIFRHPIRLLATLNLIRTPHKRLIEAIPGRLCYLLHNSLPHSSGGYATRSQGLASALREAGWDVVALTRPGFPIDVSSELAPEEIAREDQINGIRYIRSPEPSRVGLGTTQYVELAASVVEAELRQQRPEVVVAASNHLTALPALIAARRLGLPFYYEVRGFWEITRASREPEFTKHINFWIQKSLEAAVAKHADGVFTLTQAMQEELQERGVPGSKITLLPNSCDTGEFFPRDKDQELQEKLAIPEGVPVIGYVGTFVSYEGLDDLALACGLLKRQGREFRLLLVGNEDASGSGRGAISQTIENHASEAGFLDWLIMPGRVPHQLVPRYYSLIDITPFPRKALPVCEMVSPIKPLEALAMEKAVVVSDVRALAEMVDNEETGLLFRKGDVNDLAEKLAMLIEDGALRKRLGQKGRQWVQQERSWRSAARQLSMKIAERGRPAAG